MCRQPCLCAERVIFISNTPPFYDSRQSAAASKRADASIEAAEASVGAVISNLLETSWPVLDALARRFSAAGDSAVIDGVGRLWGNALRSDCELPSFAIPCNRHPA